MKIRFLIIGLFVALLTAGCSQAGNKAKNSNGTMSKQASKSQDAVANTNDIKEYSFEKKAEFITDMNKQLAELETNIEELSTKIETASDKVKIEAKSKLTVLKEQASTLKKQIGAATQATPTTWSGIKADSNKAYEALKLGVLQSREWLAEKIAP